MPDNFVSFSYLGSNLINPFDISSQQWTDAIATGIDGTLTESSGMPFDVAIWHPNALFSCTNSGEARFGTDICNNQNNLLRFQTMENGSWSMGIWSPLDFGNSYTISSAAQQVPAPATLGLLLIGMIGMGFWRRVHRN